MNPPVPESAPKLTTLAKIFLLPEEPRLRAGWRLLIQTAMMLVFSIIVSIGMAPLTLVLKDSVLLILSQVAEFIVLGASIYIARRFLDKRSFESLGLRLDILAAKDLLVGFGITFVMMGAIYLVMTAAGWIAFDGFAWQFDPVPTVVGGVITFFVIFLFVGWNEELLSRGYHLQTIASGTNLFWGVVLSSAVFGLLHLGNPNAAWVSALGIFFAGLFLAYGYLRTGQLWLSIGLHIGWNFFEGVVFGFPVSGLDIYALTRIRISGPTLWTGGAFGPEAGLIVLPALLVGAGLIYVYTRGRRAQFNG